MDEQILVDELVQGYAQILKLTVIIGELGQHNLKALRESHQRELRLRQALQRLRIHGDCWCGSGTHGLGHSEVCDFTHLILFGVEREAHGKTT